MKLVRKTLQVMDSKGSSSEGFAEGRDRSTGNRNATSVLHNIAASASSGEVLLGYMRKGSSGKSVHVKGYSSIYLLKADEYWGQIPCFRHAFINAEYFHFLH